MQVLPHLSISAGCDSESITDVSVADLERRDGEASDFEANQSTKNQNDTEFHHAMTLTEASPLCGNKSPSCYVCYSPVRCQQKNRFIRRSLRKSGNQVLCALGLETAAKYHLKNYIIRHSKRKYQSIADNVDHEEDLEADGDKSKPMNSKQLNNTNKISESITSDSLFPASMLLDTICCTIDWEPDLTCVFCNPATKSPYEPLTNYDQAKTTTELAPVHNSTIKSILELHETSALKAASILKLDLGNSNQGAKKKQGIKHEFLTSPGDLNLKPLTASTSKSEVSRKKSKPKGSFRKYSPAELTAAIDEVEKGRVGTRKAALLYGIPRSTLRNKVGKLLSQKHTPNQQDQPQPSRNSNSSGAVSAASADVTVALKRIISRHLSEKIQTNSEEKLLNSKNLLRSKRGRYRKYDKDDLEEALNVVKKGKMTVHRAGHFFGIPHSTLEYKIKERSMQTRPGSETKDTKSRSLRSSPITVSDTPELAATLADFPSSTLSLTSFPWSNEVLLPGQHFTSQHVSLPDVISSLYNSSAMFPDYCGRINLNPSLSSRSSAPPQNITPFRPWIVSDYGSMGSDMFTLRRHSADGIEDLRNLEQIGANRGNDEPLNLIKTETA